jgi:hypothetical protein
MVPPFAEGNYRWEELDDIWAGPWETLEPSGSAEQKVKRPLISLVRQRSSPKKQEQARAALKQAVAIIGERRTYGPLVGGEAGSTRLAAALKTGAEMGDVEAAKKLALWEEVPRQCLIGSRTEACEFLEEASLVLEGDAREAVLQAAAVYRSALNALTTRWPGLAVGAQTTTPELRERYAKAAEEISAVAAAEHKVAGLLNKASGP